MRAKPCPSRRSERTSCSGASGDPAARIVPGAGNIFPNRLDARQQPPLLQAIADQRRLLIFATKPPLAALTHPAVLLELPALTLTFEPDLQIVQEMLGQLGAELR